MSETVAVVDYGSGNLRSAAKAFERAAAEANLDINVTVTADANAVRKADRIVLPGVGAFGDCRAGLAAVPGMMDALSEAVVTNGQPFFGICVGMQLMAKDGFEHGTHTGLGWVDGHVEAMRPTDRILKIPHMGWNTIELTEAGYLHPVTRGIKADDHAYFVHSYHMNLNEAENLLGFTDYGGRVTAIIGKDNMIGTQFHPEKSQAVGLGLIRAFLEWRP